MAEETKNNESETKKQSYPNPITLQEGGDAIRGITISKSNKLVEAQNRLSAREQKVLAACLALINPLGEYPNGVTVELTDQQLEGLTGIKKRNIYEFIDNAAKNYHSIPIETPGKKKGSVDYINIAHRSVYDPEERKFAITFHPEMEQHLIELVRYTRYELKYLVKLTTKYAMRLYELMCMTYNHKKGGVQYWRVSLEDLYFPLGLTDIKGQPTVKSYVQNYPSFRRRVLEPSIEQINERTDLRVTVGPYKRGNTIAGLTFQVTRQTPPDEHNILPAGDVSTEQQLVSLGISAKTAATWIKRFGEERLNENLAVYKSRIELGHTIDNPAAYFNFLVTNNVAALPEIANPYSSRYKNKSMLMEFVRRVVVPIWWDLDQGLRDSLAEPDMALQLHMSTSEEVEQFVSIAKSSNLDEAEALVDKETVKFEWNKRSMEQVF